MAPIQYDKHPFDHEAKLYDLFHKEINYRQKAVLLKKKYPGIKTVLEIGCGTGNLTLELEKLGLQVLGIDSSKEMLKLYKGKTYLNTSIENLEMENRFDLIIAAYDVFNYISRYELPNVMKKIRKLGKHMYYEVWPDKPVRFVTIKRAGNILRIRIGLQLLNKVFIWYIYTTNPILVCSHTLYIHRGAI
jgi:2-polyprenyl-3-methyl-5-hydroxy-6-metoxy-1,4-benzoquinol methylase